MKICCVKTTSIPEKIKKCTIALNIKYTDFLKTEDCVWVERAEAETNTAYQQLIPYIIVKNEQEKFACYKRHGNEKRLHGKLSAGIGGHVDEPDKAETLKKTLLNGMFRELSEEIENFDRNKCKLTYLGIINEIESEVGAVHFGIVYLMDCENGYIPRPADELKELTWKTASEIKNSDTELWTKLAFDLVRR